jgi:hypothetical protein
MSRNDEQGFYKVIPRSVPVVSRFLIRDPMRAILRHKSGVPVTVPDLARYAVHKMILATSSLSRLSALRPSILRVYKVGSPEACPEAFATAERRGLRQSQRVIAIRYSTAPRQVRPRTRSFLGRKANCSSFNTGPNSLSREAMSATPATTPSPTSAVSRFKKSFWRPASLHHLAGLEPEACMAIIHRMPWAGQRCSLAVRYPDPGPPGR